MAEKKVTKKETTKTTKKVAAPKKTTTRTKKTATSKVKIVEAVGELKEEVVEKQPEKPVEGQMPVMESQVSDLGFEFDIVGGPGPEVEDDVKEVPPEDQPREVKEEPEVEASDVVLAEDAPSNVKELLSTNDKTFAGGDRNCYLYVDINLTVNSRFGTPISIGAITPDGDTFYAEISDYNMKTVTPDVFMKVIRNLIGADKLFDTIIKPSKEVREDFVTWIHDKFQPNNKMVQIVMDKVEWNWPVLKEFICADADEFPKWISPIVIDLNSDLANTVTIEKDKLNASINGEGDLANFIPALEIYKSIDRFETATSLGGINQMIMLADNSNALKKAMCIRSIHQNLWGFGKA